MPQKYGAIIVNSNSFGLNVMYVCIAIKIQYEQSSHIGCMTIKDVTHRNRTTIISGSCLLRDGYSFKSENNDCSISMSNIFYGHAPNVRGLFIFNLDSDMHIHNIETKRVRFNNDSAIFLWHCRLGHIGVKRMKKLHADGLLESLDFDSLDTCEPCLMGKMTKTPFSGTMEHASDLLEIIHTYVFGPMSVEARGEYHC